MLLSILVFTQSFAYVIICPYDNGNGERENCLWISKVKKDGEWVEANCDNIDVPDGYFIWSEC